MICEIHCGTKILLITAVMSLKILVILTIWRQVNPHSILKDISLDYLLTQKKQLHNNLWYFFQGRKHAFKNSAKKIIME